MRPAARRAAIVDLLILDREISVDRLIDLIVPSFNDKSYRQKRELVRREMSAVRVEMAVPIQTILDGRNRLWGYRLKEPKP